MKIGKVPSIHESSRGSQIRHVWGSDSGLKLLGIWLKKWASSNKRQCRRVAEQKSWSTCKSWWLKICPSFCYHVRWNTEPKKPCFAFRSSEYLVIKSECAAQFITSKKWQSNKLILIHVHPTHIHLLLLLKRCFATDLWLGMQTLASSCDNWFRF